MSKTRQYNEESISYFSSDLAKLRAKPAMYIGPVDAAGIFTILREAMDNSVDEARAGRNKLIHTFLTKSAFWVQDAGVGIPVKKHAKAGISTLTHVLTALQSSGKMKGDAYTSAIGTHGVGIKATNALSKSFEVWTYREDSGGWHYTKFEQGKEKTKVGKSKAPKLPNGKSPKSGTVICFTPDDKIFGKHQLDTKQLVQWCEITAYMNPGLRIVLENSKGKTKEWLSKEGIKEYLAKRLEALKAKALNPKPLEYHSASLEVALSFADVDGNAVEFFTNTIRNVDKGFHADGFSKALRDALKPYNPKAKKKDKELYSVNALEDGLVGILNYKIDAPQFSSQTKEKLVDVRMKEPCYKECLEMFSQYFSKNKALAKQLVQRAIELHQRTQSFKQDKKLIKNVKDARKGMESKLAAIQGNAPVSERELFIVEGDSAGGGLKRIRNRRTQAIFPIRGKPLNPIDAKQDKVNNNAEIVGILAALGMNLDGKNPEATVAYGKVILLSDADVDGKHINTIEQAILWKYAPHLFHNGNVYSVKSPLYKGKHKGEVYFGMTKDEIYKKAGSTKADCTYLKGWGELNDEDLEVAITPGIRTLIKIMPPSKDEAKELGALLGSDVTYRKRMLGIANGDIEAEPVKKAKAEKPKKADKKVKAKKGAK